MTSEQKQRLRGIGLLLLAVFIFPIFDSLAKYLGQLGNPVMLTVWARMTLGTMLLAPLLVHREGFAALKPRAINIHMIRALVTVISTYCFFSALKTLGLAETLSLFFIQPIIVTAAAPLLLGESVGWQRWLAVTCGFIGVLIILQPGFVPLSIGAFYALASGFASAIGLLTARQMRNRASALANTFYSSLGSAALCCLLAYWSWDTPTTYMWQIMIIMAMFGTVANYLVIKAHEICEASILSPFGYAEMVGAITFGWFIFGEMPKPMSFVGIAILLATAIYVARLETKK